MDGWTFSVFRMGYSLIRAFFDSSMRQALSLERIANCEPPFSSGTESVIVNPRMSL